MLENVDSDLKHFFWMLATGISVTINNLINDIWIVYISWLISKRVWIDLYCNSILSIEIEPKPNF